MNDIEEKKKDISKYVHEKHQCECGGTYSTFNGTKHRATKRHVKHMEKKKEIENEIQYKVKRQEMCIALLMQNCIHMANELGKYKNKEKVEENDEEKKEEK